MTWQGKRRQELPPDWTQRRAARLELDGYRCTHIESDLDLEVFIGEIDMATRRCTARATDVHHAFDPQDHRVQSLRSLCADHHKVETQAEAMAARGVGPTRLRPRRPHPGLR